jgi:DNA helicase HerA-like ATPase
VDECQNFLNLGNVEDMLAEARGFRLGLVLAHQNLAQLPPETAAGISANARSKVYFTVDPDDAKQLAKHTLPELSDHDLAHLDARHAAARLLVDGRELPAFTFTTNPPPPPLGHAAEIRAACAARSTPPDTKGTTPERTPDQARDAGADPARGADGPSPGSAARRPRTGSTAFPARPTTGVPAARSRNPARRARRPDR